MILKDWNIVVNHVDKLINELYTTYNVVANYKGYRSSYTSCRGIELMIYDADNNYYKSIYSGTFNTSKEIIDAIDNEYSKFIDEELN